MSWVLQGSFFRERRIFRGTLTGILNVDIVEVLTKIPNKNNQPDNKFKGIQPSETLLIWNKTCLEEILYVWRN